MSAEPLVTTDSIMQMVADAVEQNITKPIPRSNHEKLQSRAASFHSNHGQPLRTELSVQYPNMPRRERRRLARLMAEIEIKKEKVNE